MTVVQGEDYVGIGDPVSPELCKSSRALSLMFQREVKRHLARLDFPNSPDADPAEKLTADT
jgi:hypothetical protein